MCRSVQPAADWQIRSVGPPPRSDALNVPWFVWRHICPDPSFSSCLHANQAATIRGLEKAWTIYRHCP